MPSVGPNICGVGVSIPYNSSTAWTTPGNITTDDSSNTSVSLATDGYSDALVASSFGFTGTEGMQLHGIEVSLNITAYTPDALSFLAKLKLGTEQGAWRTIPEALGLRTVGGPHDTWDTTFDGDDVLDSTFGVAIYFDAYTMACSVSIDYVSMTVYYAPFPETNSTRKLIVTTTGMRW